ncbi:MAG: serine protease [Verrucomicrobiia bacterium]|jgi:hypothetical protein
MNHKSYPTDLTTHKEPTPTTAKSKGHRWIPLFATVAVVLLLVPIASAVLPDNYLLFSVLIKLSDGSFGSGFFYGSKSNVFLVTAKHVIFNPETGNLNAQSAKVLYYYNQPSNTPANTEMSIDLVGLYSNTLIKAHSTQDMAVIHLGKMISTTQYVYNAFIMVPHPIIVTVPLKKYEDVQVSDEVYLFGYPSSIGIRDIAGFPPQIDYNLPLLRKAIVAGKNPNNRTIVLDSPTYFGNSGGPVLAIENPSLGIYKFKLIGVISQYIPFAEHIENKTYRVGYIQLSNSGFSVVTPADSILDIVW